MTIWRHTRPLTADEQSELRVPFSRTAPHLRGRVFKRGRTWYMQVINTRTGAVLASDNTNSYEVMAQDARVATAVARGAWTYNLKREALR